MSEELSKQEVLGCFSELVSKKVHLVAKGSLSREDKAKAVNQLVNDSKRELVSRFVPQQDRSQTAGLIIQYCYTVANLEFRHKVWPYEYMAFSRRIGELWEQFCSAAWDYATRSDLFRITAPEFSSIKSIIRSRIVQNIGEHANLTSILTDVDILFDIVGDINMKEDEVFSLAGLPHVIDFKSGFGSNEKGNMLRLKTVGQAYRLWNHETKLFLLVRQEANNNYLNVLKRMGLWTIHTGAEAYQQISQMTGADIQWVRENIIDWEADLSKDFYAFLRDQNILGYLEW